ncbi:MAG: HAD family phosphatase, partial [Erysipelotrichaceae bacterium]|nr:HAD family phosphatase [Erysipelotrichaceae bacterium]
LQRMIYKFYKDEVQLKDGIIDVLELLKKKDYSLYIVTSSSKELIDVSFQRLKIDDYFKDIYTCDDLGINKNKQFYLEVLHRIHAQASDCIVFEDNVDNAMYAKQCGMKVVGIEDHYARGNMQDIADIYIKKWRDLNEDSFNDSR